MEDPRPETLEEAGKTIEHLNFIIEVLASMLDHEHLEHKKLMPDCFVCRLIEQFGKWPFGRQWVS